MITTQSAAATATPLRFAEFQTAALQQFVPLRVATDRPDEFRRAMRSGRTEEVRTVELTADHHQVQRTPELIVRGGTGQYKLTLQLDGMGLLVQDGREAVLRPGDIAIYDTDRPYSLMYDDDCRILVLIFPQHLLHLPVGAVRQMTAVRFAGDGGVGSVVSPLLARLARAQSSVRAGLALRLTYGALDFVGAMIGEELDLLADGADPRSALLRQIRAYIADHLGSTTLCPAEIAAAHYISTRHLHDVFHEQGTTVSSYIREQRLERCRRALIDQRLAGQPISVIAGRYGLHDAAHFSRIFKSTYGVSPSDYRARIR